MEFNDFLNRYEKEALQVDLRTEYPLVFDVLERQKKKLNSVNFDSEIDEVIAFCKKAVTETKQGLNNAILSEHYNHPNLDAVCLMQIKLYFEYLHLYNKAIDKKQTQPQQNNTKIPDEVNTHPKYNPNLWNEKCYNLFKYIFDNYYNGKKRQLTNIWFYLKEYHSPDYVLKVTKDNYVIFINENYNISITNFDKAPIKYEDKEKGTMNEHRINFEHSLK